MKSMRPNSEAIFFMTYFYRAGEGDSPPPQSATVNTLELYLQLAKATLLS